MYVEQGGEAVDVDIKDLPHHMTRVKQQTLIKSYRAQRNTDSAQTYKDTDTSNPIQNLF